jgi:hypothetical protein
MNRRSILTLSAISAVGLACLSGDAIAQTKSLKDQLVGTWTLVSWEQTNKDGTKLQRYGANPKGVMVFDANGRIFLMFARPDLPKIASNDLSTPTPEEAKALVYGTLAYFGTFSVNDADKTLNTHLEASSFPNQLAGNQKRTITSLTADDLKIDLIGVAGNKISEVFRRAK